MVMQNVALAKTDTQFRKIFLAWKRYANVQMANMLQIRAVLHMVIKNVILVMMDILFNQIILV